MKKFKAARLASPRIPRAPRRPVLCEHGHKTWAAAERCRVKKGWATVKVDLGSFIDDPTPEDKARTTPWIDRDSPEYLRRRLDVLLGYVTIRQCKTCGSPRVDGYCCRYCRGE